MGKLIDLTGKVFGRLTVIKRVENNKWGRPMWLCQCDCGNRKIINGNNLKSKHAQSCGCIRGESIKESKRLNKKYNTYDLSGDYGIGYTFKEEEFYFDLEDYNLIKKYRWYKTSDGYLAAHLDENKCILMHRLVMNCPYNMEVDHIYHVNHDNRKNELRIVTDSQNSINQIISKGNTSGVKGVDFHKLTNRWRARITINNKNMHLGRFDTFEDAVEARKEAEEKYFGEYNLKEKIKI